MTGELPTGRRRRRSQAVAELERAPVSTCPACGRETRTVNGVCADCWAPKEPGARPVFPTEPRTWPLFGWNLDFLELLGAYRLIALAFGLAALVTAAVLGLR